MLNNYNLALIGFGMDIVELYKNSQKTRSMLQDKVRWQSTLYQLVLYRDVADCK